ncbi:MAG: glucose/mannose transport system substrate-binding protein [Acetobacteraceae bacterium]|jgi:glucose/mannose transport system substrate-binding protein|nr:glucose/mannose transport system substrate-binding protein [Acetobacteraceae bacterium]
MAVLSRRTLLAATGAAMAAPAVTRAEPAKPRLTAISQWAAGSDGAAISALGKLFEQNGGIWQHSPVPGFTTDMMNKLRAQIMSGDPPAASQLKGPEIAAWSKIAPTVDLDATVAEAGYEQFVPPELAALHKPYGHWIALPLQLYRLNTMFASKKAMDKVGSTALPKTWAEFNQLATKMKAAGIIPLANGGIRYDDGMKWEIALNGISPTAYRKAIMELDTDALNGPEVLAAFEQTRKLADGMNPSIAAQGWSVQVAPFIRGEIGMLLMGGWAQGNILNGGFTLADFISGPAPQDNGRAAYIMNADAFILWKRKEPDLQAGQLLFAKLVMQLSTQEMYSHITGSIPVRTDADLSGQGWSDGQRSSAQGLKDALKEQQVVLSLAHNMAQPNPITAAMIDVLTEYVHNKDLKPKEAQQRLADAVDSAR